MIPKVSQTRLLLREAKRTKATTNEQARARQARQMNEDMKGGQDRPCVCGCNEKKPSD